MKQMSVAIIGSRRITEKQFDYLVKVGEAFARRGWVVRTGCADGADHAGMTGTRNVNPDLLHLFLPWSTYNKGYQEETDTVTIYDEKQHQEWAKSVSIFHPAPDKLKQGAFKLMARNYGIIMHGTPVDVVVAFPISDTDVGGTGQGMRLAKEYEIPLYTVCNRADRLALKQFIESIPIR